MMHILFEPFVGKPKPLSWIIDISYAFRSQFPPLIDVLDNSGGIDLLVILQLVELFFNVLCVLGIAPIVL